jgi:hypothetical protein
LLAGEGLAYDSGATAPEFHRFPRRPPSIQMLPVTTRPLTHVPIRARLDLDSTYLDLLWPLLVMSAGLGLCTAPAPAAIIAGTPVEKHGVAAAVNDAARGVGAAIGIALAGSILVAGYSNLSGGTAGRTLDGS